MDPFTLGAIYALGELIVSAIVSGVATGIAIDALTPAPIEPAAPGSANDIGAALAILDLCDANDVNLRAYRAQLVSHAEATPRPALIASRPAVEAAAASACQSALGRAAEAWNTPAPATVVTVPPAAAATHTALIVFGVAAAGLVAATMLKRAA